MRHNKKRNSALLYEFLVRHISNCLINNQKSEAGKAMSISRKYFSKGTELYKDLRLFNTILGTKVKSRNSAQKVMNEVLSTAISNTNVRKLDMEKSKLIKEINHTFSGEEFYSYKIPNYTVYASIQTLFGDRRNKKKILNSIDRIKLEDNIVEHLVRAENSNNVIDTLKVNPNYNNAVYKFAIERFHKKYDKKLNESQKRFLTKYAVYLISENKGIMQSAIQKEVEIIKEELKNIRDESIAVDKDLMSKINECYKKLVTTNFDNICERNILDILQYMKLVEEVKS